MNEEISKAMDAHSLWRTRLEDAIEKGSIDVPLDIIKTDNNCAFGKWIFGNNLTDEIKNSEIFGQIKTLHAKFHIEAGKIAELAIQGKKQEALDLLNIHGEYNTISSSLMQLLIKWRKQLS